jgi:putative spermidine/putrescine transport system ATP-binding protein
MDKESRSADPVNLAGLELASLTQGYGGQPVVRDLSLRVGRGEMFCLLGPSGCGKTTVLKIIAGLLETQAGEVFLEARNITRLPPQKRHVALVFQNYALFPHMNVFENVAYGLRRRGMSGESLKQPVGAMLAFLHLGDYSRRAVHELSGGEQQRVALARALVTHPRALLLDEPLSNLDARLRSEIRREIRRIQRELGLTTVYVTHDQEEVMSLADRIGVINNGQIEQIGPPREIYENPATGFVADFIGHSNFFEGEIDNGSLFALGRLFPMPDVNFPHGAKVTGSVRQERVRLAASEETLLPGRVKEAIFFGATVRYQLALEGGVKEPELVAEVPVSQATFRPGESVGIEILPEDIRIFSR